LLILFLGCSVRNLSAQHDADSLKNILITQSLNEYLKPLTINFDDSTLDLFHQAEPTYKKSILPADLGNIGSASIFEDFFNRPDDYSESFIFNLPYNSYIKNAQNVIYFNTRRPYTSVMHTTSSKILDLQTIDFIHTQNINPDWNFGLKYDFISSLGQYLSEKKSINSVGITTNYKKNKYTLFASYVFNKFKLENSGGYNDTVGFDTKVPQPFLSNSETLLYNQELSLTQNYLIGKYKNLSYRDTIIKIPEAKFSISHNITLSRRYRLYIDKENQNNFFYPNNYFQQTFTYDSVAVISADNKFIFRSEEVFEKKNKLSFSVSYNGNFYQIYNFKDYILLQNKNIIFDNKISGTVNTIKFRFADVEINGNYFFSGYRKNDYKIKGIIRKKLFHEKFSSDLFLIFRYQNKKANYFLNNYYSNHYIWENNFIPTKRTDINLNWNFKKIFLNMELNVAEIRNYIFFDISAKPAQTDEILRVAAVSISKKFKLKHFVFEDKVLWQKTSDDNILSLPELAVYQSSYGIIHTNPSLLVYLGYEVYYNTFYKAYNFNPATGFFYYINNDKKLAGNYPQITLFADLKIKKNVMLFFKYMNVLSGIPSSEVLPFYINRYPISGRMFKFGVRWTFKN